MVRKYDGKDLAKVLIYYGVINDVTSSEFNVVCPFHEDINPSMRINMDDGSFFCFGCRAMGNAYDFVRMANPELNDLQVALLLEEILNSREIKQLKVQYKHRKKKGSRQALAEAKDYYYGLRTSDWMHPKTRDEREVLSYMRKRGFGAEALNHCHCKVNYNVAYPFLFPILDNGMFKGWVGRTTNKWTEQKRKYLYNDGFRKRDTLCGTYDKNSIVFLCEGFMDYMALRERGHIRNVCALLGWHISDEQTEKLKQNGVTVVVSALDNDKCGNKGTEYLKRFFRVVRFPFPEGVKDPGEMDGRAIRKAKEQALREARKEGRT